VKRETEILDQQGLMTISPKYPYFIQQETFSFLVKIAEVHNNSHIKKFQSNLLIKKQRYAAQQTHRQPVSSVQRTTHT